MGKRKKEVNNSILIDKNVEKSNIVLGDGTVNQETHLTVNNVEYYEKEDADHYYQEVFDQAKNDFSREIRETILISILTGVCLTLSWSKNRDFAELIPYASAVLIAIIFSIFRVTKLGLRHSFIVGSYIGIVMTGWAYLLKQYTAMDYLASEVLIIAVLGNSLVGIFVGIVIGFFVSIFRPLDI